MRYNHFDMLPEKAFQPVGKRMTLEGGGNPVKSVGSAVGSAVGGLGGAGNVIGPAIQLGTGSSPLGVFGGALGGQLAGNLFGGGGNSGGAGGNFGMGRNMLNQNIPMGGPFGVNPASYQFFNNQPRFGTSPQPRPQVLPQVTPQVPTQTTQLGTQIQSLLNTPGQVGALGGMPAQGQNPQVAELIRQGNMQGAMDLQNSLAIQNGKDIVPRPFAGQGNDLRSGFDPVPFRGGMGLGGVGQVQQALGGAPVSLHDAYKTFLAQANPAQGQALPTYDQWVQQVSQPKPMPQVFPQKPGVPGFGLSTAMQPYFQELAQQAVQQPQVFPQKPGLSTTMQPRPQVSPPNPGLGLAGLANALQGQYK